MHFLRTHPALSDSPNGLGPNKLYFPSTQSTSRHRLAPFKKCLGFGITGNALKLAPFILVKFCKF